jgi:hypothetical protein
MEEKSEKVLMLFVSSLFSLVIALYVYQLWDAYNSHGLEGLVFSISIIIMMIVFFVIKDNSQNAIRFIMKLMKSTFAKEKQKSIHRTPKNLLFLAAIFLPANIRETSLGDVEELYKKDVKRFGVKKAKWLMFKDIVVSNYPIMKEFARKSAIKIIKFAGVYEAVRRIIG